MHPSHVQHRAPQDRQTDRQAGTEPPQPLGDPHPSSTMTSAHHPPVWGSAPHSRVPAALSVMPPHKKAPKVAQLTQNGPTVGVPPPRAKSTVGQGGCEGHRGAGRGVPRAPGSIVWLRRGGWHGGAGRCQDTWVRWLEGGRRGTEAGGTPPRVPCLGRVPGDGGCGWGTWERPHEPCGCGGPGGCTGTPRCQGGGTCQPPAHASRCPQDHVLHRHHHLHSRHLLHHDLPRLLQALPKPRAPPAL